MAGVPPQGGTAITTDLSQNDRAVHIDFFDSKSYMYMTSIRNDPSSDFDDIFNDDALD